MFSVVQRHMPIGKFAEEEAHIFSSEVCVGILTSASQCLKDDLCFLDLIGNRGKQLIINFFASFPVTLIMVNEQMVALSVLEGGLNV